jgi:hypothetical protein
LTAALLAPLTNTNTTTTSSSSSMPPSPLPLFLAQTLAHRARKSWASGGIGAVELGQAAGLMLRYCGAGDQQVTTQVGLALCAAAIACPRIAPGAVFGEAMALVERAAAAAGGAGGGVGDAAGVLEGARLRLLQLLPEEASRSRCVTQQERFGGWCPS